MEELSRYSVHNAESGVEDGILKNKLGTRSQKELEDAEALYLSDTYDHFLSHLKNQKLKFNLNLLFQIHQYFLEPLYDWAGKMRTVDISKDGILFVPAKHLSNALKEFERILVASDIENHKQTKKEFSEKLAIIHCEFNAIHPFREGNGRVIRLFLDLSVIAAGYLPIDFSKSKKEEYIKACIDGMKKEYKRMQKVIERGLSKR